MSPKIPQKLLGYINVVQTKVISVNELCCFQSYQDEEEGGAFDGHASSFPKDFGYGAFDGEHDVNLSASGEQKPRILLMGLRRWFGLTAKGAPIVVLVLQIWKILDTESRLSQNVPQRNPLPGEYK